MAHLGADSVTRGVGMSQKFDEVSEFISSKMRMSHIYQPAMLIELLTNHGLSAQPGNIATI